MQQINKIVLRAVAGLLLGAAAPAAMAQSLLDSAGQDQLAGWLGEGPLSLTAIYTKAPGDTSRDFHLAADGKGRTFSVMEASNGSGQTWLVGGYNPQSWSSTSGYHLTPNQADRTAFIFNLTSSKYFMQAPNSYALGTVGANQTYNDIDAGPTFGIGPDLGVSADLTTNGISYRYSYIDPVSGTFGASLLDGQPYASYPNVTYGAMQVFAISAVPEPSAAALLLLGLLSLAALRRQRRA